MACRLSSLGFAAHDPRRLAGFWAGLLRLADPFEDVDGSCVLAPRAEPGFTLRFRSSGEPKVVANRMHFDLTSVSSADQQRIVDCALELGGRHIDIGQLPGDGHVVLADPEGNEFCVIEPDNAFLADTAAIGALSCDGTQHVGYFWSQALGWPLVWDQDEETAIQSPQGGSKISWGGPPVAPQVGRNRLQLELEPTDAGLDAETERLVGLGARRLDDGQVADRVVLADPDDNEFWLLLSR